MDDMIDLPRNPVDFKIDALDHSAVNSLQGWTYTTKAPKIPKQQVYHRITPWMQQLLDQGLVEQTVTVIHFPISKEALRP